MSQRDDRRRPPLWVAAFLLLALAVWLLVPRDEGEDATADFDAAEVGRETRAAEMLTAERGAEAPPAAGPALVGRAEDPEAGPKRGPVRVKVLGAGDHPLVGVVVEALPKENVGQNKAQGVVKAAADADGVAVFADLPYDGTLAACVRTEHSVALGAGIVVWISTQGGKPQRVYTIPLQREPITGPEIVLRVDAGLPLHVDVVAADSGRRVPGSRWRAKPAFTIRYLGDQATLRHGPPIAVRHGQDEKVDVAVEPRPEDHVLHDAANWNVRAHPAARRLVAQMPLRPEARVYVTFEEPEGIAADAAWKPTCTLGKTQLKNLAVDSDAYGRRRLRGVPHIPGERIQVGGTYGKWGPTATGRLPLDPSEPLLLAAKLSPIHRATIIQRFEASRFVISGTAVSVRHGTLRLLSESAIKLDLSELIRARPHVDPYRRRVPSRPPPRFDVHVQGSAGEPVWNAQVRIGEPGKKSKRKWTQTTSRKGVARFEGLPQGAYDLVIWGAGAPITRSVVVPEDGNGSILVRGGAGALVHLFVVDEDGNPMPFATLKVEQPSGMPWCDIVDGTQRIDPFTDALGRRILNVVEAGEVKITATLGSRSGSTTVKVPSGGTTHAQIVLAWPKPEPASAKKPKR